MAGQIEDLRQQLAEAEALAAELRKTIAAIETPRQIPADRPQRCGLTLGGFELARYGTGDGRAGGGLYLSKQQQIEAGRLRVAIDRLADAIQAAGGKASTMELVAACNLERRQAVAILEANGWRFENSGGFWRLVEDPPEPPRKKRQAADAEDGRRLPPAAAGGRIVGPGNLPLRDRIHRYLAVAGPSRAEVIAADVGTTAQAVAAVCLANAENFTQRRGKWRLRCNEGCE